MNRDLDTTRLPEPVERYFREVATMQPPADLMNDVLDQIEATPSRTRHMSAYAMPMAATFLAVAVIAAGVWAISPAGPIGTIGSQPDASPTASPSPSPSSSPAPVPMAASPDVDALPRATYPTMDIDVEVDYLLRVEGHGSLWMYRWDTNTVLRYDPETGEEQARIELGAILDTLDSRDTAMVVTDRLVYAAAAGDLIVAIDPETNEFSEFTSGLRATELAVDAETLWAVDSHSAEILRFDLGTRDQVARILTPPEPDGIDLALDGDAWVVSAHGVLLRIDGESSEIDAEYPIRGGGTFLDVVGDAVYITGFSRPVERFSISEERVTREGAVLHEVQEVRDELIGLDRNGYLAFLDPVTLEWTAVMDVNSYNNATIVPADDGAWLDINGATRTVTFVRLSD